MKDDQDKTKRRLLDEKSHRNLLRIFKYFKLAGAGL